MCYLPRPTDTARLQSAITEFECNAMEGGGASGEDVIASTMTMKKTVQDLYANCVHSGNDNGMDECSFANNAT